LSCLISARTLIPDIRNGGDPLSGLEIPPRFDYPCDVKEQAVLSTMHQ